MQIETIPIFEKVVSVTETEVDSLLVIKTTKKTFLLSLANQNNFRPRVGFCYEFFITTSFLPVCCSKMVAKTVDIVLIHNDSIPLIRRKHEPFKGELALPGGFIDENETPDEAAARELYEETNLLLDKNKFTPVTVQSNPFRDPRNKWTKAHVFAAQVENLDGIKAGDDADSYEIVPIKQLKDKKLAFDHLESINQCLKFME